MLMYLDPHDHYVAVPPQLRFEPINGFRSCFDGEQVPWVVCQALIRQHGGQILTLNA